MLTRTSAFFCATAKRSLLVANELQKIIPAFLPLFDPPVVFGENVSAAHLIVVTSHTFKGNNVHIHDCPVFAGSLPLSELANHSAFLKNPCFVCLGLRIHFLASEHFCMNLEEQCLQGSGDVPAELDSMIKCQFGSIANLENELVMYATSRREPGWTWLVYNNRQTEGRRLVVVNLPANRVPLVIGMWPLAVINMTESRLLAAMEAKSTMPFVNLPPPSWSRAARNPLVSAASPGASTIARVTGIVGSGDEDLSTFRVQVARDAVAQMNWSFVMQQLRQAQVYYNSAERDAKIFAHHSKLEREAALVAMGKLRDSGTTFFASDTVEITTASRDVPAESESRGKASQKSVGSSLETASGNAAIEQDPQCTQLSDGTWQYLYRNGDVTFLWPDGTRVFKKSNLTTTVFADGSTLYEYPNNTTILDRVDGVRVTTFADGTTKEEMLG